MSLTKCDGNALSRPGFHGVLSSLKSQRAKKIHPFQYLMVGAALCLF